MSTAPQLTPGPLMIDIAGLALTDLDRERLKHPLVGGIILFSRNYQCPEQLASLTAEIRTLRSPPLLIAIDHEGAGCSAAVKALRACRRCVASASCGKESLMRRWRRPVT